MEATASRYIRIHETRAELTFSGIYDASFYSWWYRIWPWLILPGEAERPLPQKAHPNLFGISRYTEFR